LLPLLQLEPLPLLCLLLQFLSHVERLPRPLRVHPCLWERQTQSNQSCCITKGQPTHGWRRRGGSSAGSLSPDVGVGGRQIYHNDVVSGGSRSTADHDNVIVVVIIEHDEFAVVVDEVNLDRLRIPAAPRPR
jgi:hypothetical protein